MRHADVRLSNGNVLSVDYEDAFIDKIRQAYNIAQDEPVSDDHIRMFIHAAMSSAIDKHEAETNAEK